MEYGLACLILGAAAATWWVVAKPPALFVIRVRLSQATTTRGKVTPDFLEAVADICRDSGLASGEVRGVRQGRRVALWFSPGFPAGACQRLRNWWALSGWSVR